MFSNRMPHAMEQAVWSLACASWIHRSVTRNPRTLLSWLSLSPPLQRIMSCVAIGWTARLSCAIRAAGARAGHRPFLAATSTCCWAPTRRASCASSTAILWLACILRIIRRIHVREGERTLQVNLDDRAAFADREVMHRGGRDDVPAWVQRLSQRDVRLVAHSHGETSGKHGDVLIGRMPVRRDRV